MKIVLKFFSLGLLMFFFVGLFNVQIFDNIIMIELGEMNVDKFFDDIVEKCLIFEKCVLFYDYICEVDIFWEKCIWWVIDVCEKMNFVFVYFECLFFIILMEVVEVGEIIVYSIEDDKFFIFFMFDEVVLMGVSVDIIVIVDLEMYEEIFQVVCNEVDFIDVKCYCLKEIWFFDEEIFIMQVCIFGIVLFIEEFDDNGNFRYECFMFWVYYFEVCEVLVRECVFNIVNDFSFMSYEDLFEMWFFLSYIYKEFNVFDCCFEDYFFGIDLFMELEWICQEIFNFEYDLWFY